MTDYIVNIDETNAAQLLIEESHQRPVVVDFWADRCEPCKVLMPLLESIAHEFQGAFLLANGLLELAERQSRQVDSHGQLALAQQVKTLSLPQEMGHKFKVLALAIGSLPEMPAMQRRDIRG